MPGNQTLALAVLPLLLIFLVLSLIKTSLRTLSKVTVRRLADDSGARTSALLGEYLLSPTEFILNLQSLIQVSLIAIAVLATTVLGRLLPDRHAVALTIAGLGLAVLGFEHFFPRFVLSVDREKLLTRLLPAYGVVAPIARVVSWPVTRLYRLLFKARPGRSADGEVSVEEVRAFIDVGEEAGILDESESKIVASLVDFSETIVREVMTPRVHVVGIETSRTVAEARDLMLETMHSRLPVYRERVDNVEGVVYIKDLLRAWKEGHEGDKVAAWSKPTLFVPETKVVSDLLQELQRARVTFAVVVDEFGGIAGVVTVEDVLVEVVGEIREG
jgi:CBS domain containing-hemolysin-like protein